MSFTPRQITHSYPSWTGVEYSSICPFNADSSRILLIHQDHFDLYDGDGSLLVHMSIPASAEPRWHPTDVKLFYYIVENRLMRSVDQKTSLVHTFAEYPALTADGRNGITGAGESDLSRDGDHLVLTDGDRSEVFVYQISTGRKSPVFPQAEPFDGLKITASNQILISRASGIWLMNTSTPNGPARRIAESNGHAACGLDANGDECLVWFNSNSNPVTPAGCDNGVVKVNLTSDRLTCLLKLPWSMACHISTCAKPFVLVSTYGADDGSPYSNQLLKVGFDGTVDVLGPHGSNVVSYTAQPKASLSRDGSKFAYGSNSGRIDTPDYCETFLGELTPAAVQPEPAPALDGEADRLQRLILALQATNADLSKRSALAESDKAIAVRELRLAQAEIETLYAALRAGDGTPDPAVWRRVDFEKLPGRRWGFRAMPSNRVEMSDIDLNSRWHSLRAPNGNQYLFVAKDGEFEEYERVTNGTG